MTPIEIDLLVSNHPEYFDPIFSYGFREAMNKTRTGHNQLGNLSQEQILQGAAIFILLTGKRPYHSSQILRALANCLNVP